MKKFFMSLMAFAAMAMTVTSCNKEEAASPDLNIAFEESEVMNEVKMHFEGDDQYWDNGDRVYIMDANNYYAYYTIRTGSSSNLVWESNVNGNFNINNGPLCAVYPKAIFSGRNGVRLPARQYSATGEISTSFPMYAQGNYEDLRFRNICGLLRLHVTGDVAIDSVSVTTDKYVNGIFTVNLNNIDNPLTYISRGYTTLCHGTKTNTVRFASAIQTSSEAQDINIYLPPATYNKFDITFYSHDGSVVKKYVKHNNNPITINRRLYLNVPATLNNTDFEPFTKGAIDVVYNVGTGNVIFSKGNLAYLTNCWNIADNQWDFRGTSQKPTISSYDRDLFAWGANGYYVNGHHNARPDIYDGNDIMIWAVNSEFGHCTATSLLNEDEWGNNKIANGGNRTNSGWRTLTAAEMTYLLNPANYAHAMVTLSFVGKKGLVIFPSGVTPVADGTSLSKNEWNALESAGCIFFVAENYRAATGAIDSRIPTTGTASYFWLNTAADENTASALVVDKTAGASIVSDADKKIGGFVRLVKDVQ